MRLLSNNRILKTISLMLVIIFMFNLFAPVYSYSNEDEEIGGKLFRPIFKLFAGVGDLVIKTLQDIFIGDGNIAIAELPEIEEKTFKIRYSPGVIFSGNIPALDANFINPGKSLNVVNTSDAKWKKLGSYSLEDSVLTAKGFSKESMKPRVTETDGERIAFVIQINGRNVHSIYEWTYKGKKYSLVNTQAGEKKWNDSALSLADNIIQGTWDKIEEVFGKEWTLYELNEEITETGEIKVSMAEQLQKNISKWYKALRLFSLVGLLSVLVYVGIRIIISSTGQEKAKYKKMIMDWLAAVCILFVLQYIMAFTMTITEQIVNIFKTNVIGVNGEDLLMTSVRQKIGNANSFNSIFGYLIMYLVLVIYTAVFTIHYLKRLVYLAFLTMIAPLIALTYPLDKIKDGQAQAFSMWLREYVFNALIPVVHIILYSIFVGSAMDFAQQNPLYAIVCIGFLIPAEKFIRKMFGFDKASTVSQIGAAASGAMVMNAINKINHGGGSKQGGENSSSGTIKTKSSSGYMPPPGERTEGQNGRQQERQQRNQPREQEQPNQLLDETQNLGREPNLNSNTDRRYGINLPQDKPRRKISGVGRGIGNVAKKYFSRDGLRIKAAQALKVLQATGKRARKISVGALGAAALGTFGLAAGVATGDLGNVSKYVAGAGAVGYGAANRIGDKLAKVEKENREIYKEGRWGTDEYNTRKSIQELNNNRAFLEASRNAGLGKKEREKLIRMFHANGITNPESIAEATNIMAANHNGAIEDGIGLEDEMQQIVAATKAHREIPKSKWTKKDKEEFKRELTSQVGNSMVADRMVRLISDLKGDIS